MKYRCETCATAADCKHAFGRFWSVRSHGGKGCDLQFAYDRTPRKETYSHANKVKANRR